MRAMSEKNAIADFITHWQGVTASELATAQSFVIELCELLGVEKPHPTDDQAHTAGKAYAWIRPAPAPNWKGAGWRFGSSSSSWGAAATDAPGQAWVLSTSGAGARNSACASASVPTSHWSTSPASMATTLRLSC